MITPIRATPPARVLRLEQLLGTRVDGLTPADVQRLVEDNVAEDLVLDYKQQLYAPNDVGADELAKDVAAFTNAAGGLILIGVEEDQRGASGIRAVPLADKARRWMVDVITRRITPLVAGVAVLPLPRTTGSDHGFYLVSVPPSAVAPHAVTDGIKLAWPVREHTQTRWMTEPEIASRYRSRFLGLADRAAQLDEVWTDGLAGLRRGAHSWVLMALTPDQPGFLRTSADTVQTTRAWLGEAQADLFQAFSPSEVSAGRRRVLLSDVPHGQPSLDRRLELHGDGSGFAALALNEPLPGRDGQPALWVDPVQIEGWVLHFVGLLTRHAVNTGAGGDVSVRAQLFGIDRESVGAIWERPAGTMFGVGTIDVALTPNAHDQQPRAVPGTRPVHAPRPVSVVSSLAAAVDPSAQVAAAAEIAADILAEFGLSEPPALTPDGTVRVDALGTRSAALTAWARRAGVDA